MPRYVLLAGLAVLLTPVLPGKTATGSPLPGRCTAGDTVRVLVQVVGLKSGQGTVRVQAYREGGFLEKGRGVARVEADPVGRTALVVCLALPAPGRYAIAVRHDADANGRSDWNDGGGFSRDPHLSLLHLRPSFGDTAVDVHSGVNRFTVTMNYRRGLRVGPVQYWLVDLPRVLRLVRPS